MRAFGGQRRMRVHPRRGRSKADLYRDLREQRSVITAAQEREHAERTAKRKAEEELKAERALGLLARLKRALLQPISFRRGRA